MSTAATTHTHNRDAADVVVLRTADEHDAPALGRLAQLDSAAPLRGEILVAEHHGRIVAARETRGGRAIADPFLHTTDLLMALAARAGGQREVAGRAVTGTPRRALVHGFSPLEQLRHA